MCWSSKSKPVRQIADSDIEIYKIMKYNTVHESYYSLHFYHKYVIGEDNAKVDLNPNMENEGEYHIFEGYHSYSPECFIGISKYMSFQGYFIIYGIEEDGRNEVLEYDDNSENLKILKCVIPKGSEYYTNKEGEMVSSNIIPKEELKLTENYNSLIKLKFLEK